MYNYYEGPPPPPKDHTKHQKDIRLNGLAVKWLITLPATRKFETQNSRGPWKLGVTRIRIRMPACGS